MTIPDDPTIGQYVEPILGMKAFDIVALNVRDLTSLADAFIICSARSHRQVSAIAEFVVEELKKKGKKPLGVEGLREGHWVLVDYGDVVIHVFYEPIRVFYDLEGLWTDAERIEISDDGRPKSVVDDGL
jgi:ribosome-associated protein